MVLSFEHNQDCNFRTETNGKIRCHHLTLELMEDQFNLATWERSLKWNKSYKCCGASKRLIKMNKVSDRLNCSERWAVGRGRKGWRSLVSVARVTKYNRIIPTNAGALELWLKVSVSATLLIYSPETQLTSSPKPAAARAQVPAYLRNFAYFIACWSIWARNIFRRLSC